MAFSCPFHPVTFVVYFLHAAGLLSGDNLASIQPIHIKVTASSALASVLGLIFYILILNLGLRT
jgi:nitrate reductase gamma subunit